MTLEYFEGNNVVEVNGVGYPKGALRYRFTGDNVTIWQIDDTSESRPVLNNVIYSNILNLNTGVSFATLSELKTFVRSNFFF